MTLNDGDVSHKDNECRDTSQWDDKVRSQAGDDEGDKRRTQRLELTLHHVYMSDVTDE